MTNKSVIFCHFLLGGAFIISLLALGSCLMPDLKPELYFSSSKEKSAGDSPGSAGDSPNSMEGVGSIAVTPKTLSLNIGQSSALSVAVLPANAAAVAWTSANPGIATVDPVTGTVTAAALGTVQITAGRGELSDTCTVTVLNSPIALVTDLDLSAKVSAPVKAGTPVTTAINAAQYTGTVAWKMSDGTTPVSGNFAAGQVYKALVTLSAKPGYTFSGVGTNSFTHTDATAVSSPANSGTVTISFPVITKDLTIQFGMRSSDADPLSPQIVRDTFTRVSNFIRSTNGSDSQIGAKIELGDYIDLDTLTVAAYLAPITSLPQVVDPTAGGFSVSNTDFGANGRLLRLIVVGINSFHSRGAYTVTLNNGTPHVVFQFQNLPGKRRMEDTYTNANGYAGSQMRTYLTVNYLAGLNGAGVPTTVLWAPKRYMAKSGNYSTEITLIEDTLWLPTEWEVFGSSEDSSSSETAANQARLDYYTSDPSRIKWGSTGVAEFYRLATPNAIRSNGFNAVAPSGVRGGAFGATGFAPAFCVR
ncbi:hypothetical protein AGMMS50268_30890 [Spirochaetia bacterium]|nr:hypothetical protein AGMMS50268_30890 [Spirochaetia bacterium]